MTDLTYGLVVHECDNGARGKFIEKTTDEKGTHYRCTGCGTWATRTEHGFVIFGNGLIHSKKKRRTITNPYVIFKDGFGRDTKFKR